MKKNRIVFLVALLLCTVVAYLNVNSLGDKNDSVVKSDEVKHNSSEKHVSSSSEKKNIKTKIISSPSSIEALVNKQYGLPEDYVPQDLVVPQVSFSYSGVFEKSYLRKEAAEALERLFNLALQDGIYLNCVSGYRSYEYQKSVHQRIVDQKGEEEANRVSAVPGFSEHQTGLVMDVSANSVNNDLEEYFGDSPEGIWLRENAHREGFIIRYPKGKEDITGYSYEPWHIRYVGKIAEEIFKKDLTLEEYMEMKGKI